MAEKPRSLAPYSCSLFTEEVFSPNEQKLFGHAVETHPLNAPSSRDATAWKDFAEEASTKAYVISLSAVPAIGPVNGVG
jgi:hypothetical protein